MGRSKPRSPSLYPDDPDSSHYAPDGRGPEAAEGHAGQAGLPGPVAREGGHS
jgi:hypothetical protein